MARQKLGQHFLANPAWRKRILRTLSLEPYETWVEIGPGHGEMTKMLGGDGRRVLAIEMDPRLAAGLRETARSWPGVEILQANALEVDLGALAGRAPAGGTLRIYGNLPYYITSPLLHRMFESANCLASIHIVIQLEVADRVVANPGQREYGYLSALCRFYARPEMVFRIPAGAFRPPPKVTSALVQMLFPGERASLAVEDERKFLGFMQRCFGQKRKTLRNNLKLAMGLREVEAALRLQGIDSNTRAEQLSLRQFSKLYSMLSENHELEGPGP
jgi:16S rRNA (adenine1518-N6/adenine1519-N6)-dimethyltransferase